MDQNKHICQICNSNDLVLRHEASYVYSYLIDSDAPGLENNTEFKSYQYDKREQKESREYVECMKCGTMYPYSFLYGVLNQHHE